MAEFTNVSTRLINLSDGTMLVPGQVTDVSDEMSGNQGFKDLVESGDIVSGKPPPEEELAKMRQERAEKAAATEIKPAQVTATRTTTTVTATPATQQPPQTKA